MVNRYISYMTFKELKYYHLKKLILTLKSGKQIEGIITSHRWNKEQNNIVGISILGKWAIERVDCTGIYEIKIKEEL